MCRGVPPGSSTGTSMLILTGPHVSPLKVRMCRGVPPGSSTGTSMLILTVPHVFSPKSTDV